MKICNGCGATLQNDDENLIGYSPKIENDLCQRCFRINHYDDLIKSYKGDFDNYDILNEVSKENRLIIWVVDLFDFDSNIIDGLNRHLMDKDIILVGTKRDLLPDTLGNNKLLQFVTRRLKFYGITVNEVLFTGDFGLDGAENVLNVIDHYRKGRDVVIMGQANAGKSTLINAIADTSITISRYPGTTLDFIKIEMDGYSLFDTPGLIKKDNMQYYVDEKDLNTVIPSRIKPKVFQLSKDTSFAIGGLVRIDVEVYNRASVVFHVNDQLNIHRGSYDKADELWSKQFNELLSPISSGDYAYTLPLTVRRSGFDIVINGLGFIKFSNNIRSVKVYRNEHVEVLVREAIL